MHLENALERFLLQLKADGRSPHTLGQYRRHVLLFAAWLDREDRSGCVGDVTTDYLAAFLASDTVRKTAAGTPRKAGSTNAIRGSLRGFFCYLVRSEVLSRDPSRLIRRALTAPAPPRGLRHAEEHNLLQVLREATGVEAERDCVLVELMLGCGLRLSSALALDVEDLDVGEGMVQLRTVKGGAEQRVFLPKRVGRALAEFLGDRCAGPVFQSVSGRRITGRHFQRRFRSWCTKAEISNAATCHSLRHSFAMRLYSQTGDVLLVKSALGHRSITSTLVYARADHDRVRSAVLAMEQATAGA